MKALILLLFLLCSNCVFSQKRIIWEGIKCVHQLHYQWMNHTPDIFSSEKKTKPPEIDFSKSFKPYEVSQGVIIKGNKKGYKKLLGEINFKKLKWRKHITMLPGCELYQSISGVYPKSLIINPFVDIWIEVSELGEFSVIDIVPKPKEGRKEKVEKILNENFTAEPAQLQGRKVKSKEVIRIIEG